MSFFCWSSIDFQPNDFFKGYAFTSSSLIMHKEGYIQYRSKYDSLFNAVRDGRFILSEVCNEYKITRLRGDPSGQSIIYYYEVDGFWVISESLLKVVERVKSSGFQIAPYQPSIDVFNNKSLSLIGGQLVSYNTPVKNLKILSQKEYIEITEKNKSYHFCVKKLPEVDIYPSYEDFLVNFVKSWKGRLNAISRLPVDSFLALSGGVDSRAILSLWSSSDPFKKLNCHSHKKYESEYKIAEELCQVTGDNFGRGMSGLKSEALSPLASYWLSMYGNAAIKTNFGFRNSIVLNKKIHFIGGCSIGSYYMKSSFQERASRLKSQHGVAGENVANEIAGALESLDIDKDDSWAMFHHYYNFRSRFHYGNEAYTQFGSVQAHPLMDSRLQLLQHYVDKNYASGNGVVRDIIMLSNKKMLGVAFESPDKIKVAAKDLDFMNSHENDLNYEVFYGEAQAFDFSSIVPVHESCDFDMSLKDILINRNERLVDIGIKFGFSDDYIADAKNEIAEFKGGKLRKSGVLLGLGEAFN